VVDANRVLGNDRRHVLLVGREGELGLVQVTEPDNLSSYHLWDSLLADTFYLNRSVCKLDAI
jgi:hypothetical protein